MPILASLGVETIISLVTVRPRETLGVITVRYHSYLFVLLFLSCIHLIHLSIVPFFVRLILSKGAIAAIITVLTQKMNPTAVVLEGIQIVFVTAGIMMIGLMMIILTPAPVDVPLMRRPGSLKSEDDYFLSMMYTSDRRGVEVQGLIFIKKSMLYYNDQNQNR